MKPKDIVYLDNAASSWPKPKGTLEAVQKAILEVGANPGRSGHRLSQEAARIIYEAREALAVLLGIDDPLRIVFTKNVTEALNIALYGLLRPGDHVITSSLEHNSVMRPLRDLEKKGVELTVVKGSPRGEIDPDDVRKAIRANTKLIALVHLSNVTGTLLPIKEIGTIARKHGVLFLVDAAQSVGTVRIDLKELPVDLFAFTGHKALFGPQGTGGIYIREGVEGILEPLMRGGTGSRSQEEEQPLFLPDKYESGTPNTPGIAGLGAGVRFLLKEGMDKVEAKKRQLTKTFIEGLRELKGIRFFGTLDGSQVGIVSLKVEGMEPSELSQVLDERYGILVRAGLHCAPSAHKTIGTFPEGTVRFSFSYLNDEEEVLYAIKALSEITSFRR